VGKELEIWLCSNAVAHAEEVMVASDPSAAAIKTITNAGILLRRTGSIGPAAKLLLAGQKYGEHHGILESPAGASLLANVATTQYVVLWRRASPISPISFFAAVVAREDFVFLGSLLIGPIGHPVPVIQAPPWRPRRGANEPP